VAKRIRVHVRSSTIAVVVDRREPPIRRDAEQGAAVREAVPLRYPMARNAESELSNISTLRST
jgi:hypothetical protein